MTLTHLWNGILLNWAVATTECSAAPHCGGKIGEPEQHVFIEGSSIMLGTSPDGRDTVGAFFFGTAADSAHRFNILALVLDSLPPGVTNPGIPILARSLSIASYLPSFTATGIDKGSISSTVNVGKSVNYQASSGLRQALFW